MYNSRNSDSNISIEIASRDMVDGTQTLNNPSDRPTKSMNYSYSTNPQPEYGPGRYLKFPTPPSDHVYSQNMHSIDANLPIKRSSFYSGMSYSSPNIDVNSSHDNTYFPKAPSPHSKDTLYPHPGFSSSGPSIHTGIAFTENTAPIPQRPNDMSKILSGFDSLKLHESKTDGTRTNRKPVTPTRDISPSKERESRSISARSSRSTSPYVYSLSPPANTTPQRNSDLSISPENKKESLSHKLLSTRNPYRQSSPPKLFVVSPDHSPSPPSHLKVPSPIIVAVPDPSSSPPKNQLTPITAETQTGSGSKRSSFLKAISPLRRHRKEKSINSDISFESDNEQEWEEKANQLALSMPPSSIATQELSENFDFEKLTNNSSNESKLQKAINLHEQGKIEESTKLFKELAIPLKEGGPGMPLAQLLFGLCLRHGWGCEVNEDLGFKYLRLAASSSAKLHEYTDSTSTKGELVLAIFELGNSFRNGWGCEKDDYTAKTYYETAARLGDLDAMIEVAQCYLDGIGTKKNKKLAAHFYRMAEKQGRIEVGNSWIWYVGVD